MCIAFVGVPIRLSLIGQKELQERPQSDLIQFVLHLTDLTVRPASTVGIGLYTSVEGKEEKIRKDQPKKKKNIGLCGENIFII